MFLLFFYRLTPSYAFVIFFQATMLYHTGTGALWEPIVGQERKDCRQNWWTGILYISNLVNSDHMVSYKIHNFRVAKYKQSF